MFLYNFKTFSTQLYPTDLRPEESIPIHFLARKEGSTQCFNITINPMSCEYTVEMYSEEPEVNILILRTKIFIDAERPLCGKTSSAQLFLSSSRKDHEAAWLLQTLYFL